MEAPAHVCKALYDLDHDLRLCYIGNAFENGEEEGEGCFGVVRLFPVTSVENPDGSRTMVQPWVPYDILERGPRVFSKTGSTARDYDPVTQAPILLFTCSSQWGMSSADVYGSRLIRLMRENVKTTAQKKLQRKKELEEKGKERKERVRGMAEEIGSGVYKDAKDQDIRFGHLSVEHRREEVAKMRRERGTDIKNHIGVENLELHREGLLNA